MRRALLACLTLFMCLGSVSVRAQSDGVKVYALGYSATDALEPAAHEIEGLARAALAGSEGFAWQGADDRVRGEVARERDIYRKALRSMRSGREAYLNFELEDAVQRLERALNGFDECAEIIDSPEQIAQSLMYLGASHVLSGDTTAALEVFERYHEQFWDVPPDESAFNPEIMSYWERAGSRVARRTPGRIRVEGEAAAWVSVDGRVRGRAPTTLRGIAPGEHTVRVFVDGARAQVTSLRVKSGETAKVQVEALAGDEAMAGYRTNIASSDGSPDAATALALARHLAIDQLLLFEVAPGLVEGGLSLSLYLLDAHSGDAIATFRRDVGNLLTERAAAVRKLVATALDKALAHRSRPVASGSGGDRGFEVAAAGSGKQDDRDGRKGWIWGLAVGGAAALVGGIVAAVLLTRDDAEESLTPPDGKAGVVLEF